MPITLESLSVFVTIFAAIIVGSYKGYREIRKRLDTQKHRNSYKFKVNTQSILNEAARAAGADRAIIVRSENSGGIPVLGKNFYTSLVAQSDTGEFLPRGAWQKELGDSFLENMIYQICRPETQYYQVSINDIDARYKHNDLYYRFKVKNALIALINVQPDSLFYMEFHYGDENRVITGTDRSVMRSAINKINKML